MVNRNLRLNHPSIQALVHPNSIIYIFTRRDNQKPFTFEGLGKAQEVYDTSPVKVIWRLVNSSEIPIISSPEEIVEPKIYLEGATERIFINKYERNPEARRECINYYGLQCLVCSFDFEKVYGELGKGYIHVHHIKPLSEIGYEYEVDPINYLRPVCSNCHAMIHRRKPPYNIDELKTIIKKN